MKCNTLWFSKAGKKNFVEAGLTFNSLTTYSQLIETAVKRGDLDKSQVETLQNWKENPNAWQA